MSLPTQQQSQTASAQTTFFKKRAPTLYAISIFKLVKGALLVALAMWVYSLSDNDLPAEFQKLMDFLRVQPDSRFWSTLAVKVGKLTEVKMIWTAVGTFIYSLFSLIEGVGLLCRISWAGWMAIGESAFFIPLEVKELLDHFTAGVFTLLVVNVVIVWYLIKNRHRLFRHHH